MAQFKLRPKRKQSNIRKGILDCSKLTASSVQNPQLPPYSCVNQNPIDYAVDTTSVNNEIENPVKVYSETK